MPSRVDRPNESVPTEPVNMFTEKSGRHGTPLWLRDRRVNMFTQGVRLRRRLLRPIEQFHASPPKRLLYGCAYGEPMRPRSTSGESAAALVLLSYDVSGANRSAASRVAHLIFGRKDAAEVAPPPYIQRPGVVWIGQSVFLLPQSIAVELVERLHGLGASVTTARISIPRAEIEAFRRRRL